MATYTEQQQRELDQQPVAKPVIWRGIPKAPTECPYCDCTKSHDDEGRIICNECGETW